ncbi:hypothetical protein NC796_01355 [Aliifodinibius sp. S!AR15-10]|uniref:kynureninase/PvdN C-terminal domain-containing protein n=1 Tax=Aliifodinibius sp. S!AR15-10 TaxID=2950437 RepID=UPI00285731D5|nr:hypothetical protein [Aliifodinibius sp. S!AR15-10]MDR8389763.1 hypothetical protein [Aliifodinibius sp. S!AR15-10]
MNKINELAQRLQPHYSHFNVGNRLLFTGHSHQAWPDVALEGLKESFNVSAKEVDDKWESAFKKTEILRSYLRDYYDDPNGMYCLAENTHHLLVAWLSSFDLKNKPKIITTDGEFHSMSRQLRRLQEEGIKLNIVKAESDDIADQIDSFADDRTAAIMLSRVYFKSSLINQYISEIAEVARTNNIPLLIDDYHGTNVAPLSLRDQNLEDCYLLTGGYKYLQWGEGNCFLRFPANCQLRPAITGWFASFNTLDQPTDQEKVLYERGNQRFASGTYDSASQFRAARVVEFFREQGLTPTVLRQQYQAQISLLRRLFLDQNFDRDFIRLAHEKPVEQNGGFLALRSPHALELQKELMNRGVYTDARGDVLRIGPAPYITASQIEQCIQLLTNSVKSLK